MSGKVMNIVIAGLGGQGVLTCSDIVADVAFHAGLDVKKSELHGMSQRGGSVSSDVRFGPQVFSPMVPAGRSRFPAGDGRRPGAGERRRPSPWRNGDRAGAVG